VKNVYLLILILVIFIGIINYYLYLFITKKGISNKFKNLLVYFLSSLLIFVFLDFYVFKFFGHGFPSSISEEKFERSPSPYDSFSGKPFYKDHNSLGFRGIEFKNYDNHTLQIAFFGGSTGYNGEPPIIDIIEKKLNKKNIKNKAFNFSSVSSNHNQHIHRLVKYSDLNFDIIIFYGGFNETLQTYLYDPRPGYPFNFWIRNELNELKYLLLKYSAIYAEYEKQTGNVSNIKKIKKDLKFKSEKWLNDLIGNYYLTLNKAKKISQNIINSNFCNKPKFFAFYQPISVNRTDDFSKKIINKTKNFFVNKDILIDISEILDENDFIDSVHVTQPSKNIIAEEMVDYIYEYTLKECS
tara:strand:+ start:649 stop:1710 length:1062 start_codon:yes stop_codon:yes gene_type:complete